MYKMGAPISFCVVHACIPSKIQFLYNHLKICPKLQNSYYHSLKQWSLGAINGTQGQTIMDLYSYENINYPKYV